MCRLPGWHAYHRCVKVDMLTSDPINPPAILASDTPQIDNLPVMLLFDLLVMKAQGWWHYHNLPRKDLQAKVKVDVVDVDALLDRAKEGVENEDECAAFRHTCEFMEWALVLARRFVRRRHRRGKWRAIGFPL